MSRFRITIRGTDTELRGYATIEALAALTAPPGEQPYVVVASPADDDFDPFAISEPEHPPTIEFSLEHIQHIWDTSETAEDCITQLAMLHLSQALVIRGERARADKAESELTQRELHHFETEEILSRVRAAVVKGDIIGVMEALD